jgi:hypothetical protein
MGGLLRRRTRPPASSTGRDRLQPRAERRPAWSSLRPSPIRQPPVRWRERHRPLIRPASHQGEHSPWCFRHGLRWHQQALRVHADRPKSRYFPSVAICRIADRRHDRATPRPVRKTADGISNQRSARHKCPRKLQRKLRRNPPTPVQLVVPRNAAYVRRKPACIVARDEADGCLQ